jgi:branched-chain amino acid transport system permease protein
VTASQFGALQALTFVSFAYVGGITSVTGAVVAGLGVSDGLISHILEKWVGVPLSYQLYVAGLLLMFTLVTLPEGIAGGPHPPPPIRILSRILVGRRRAAPTVVPDLDPTLGEARS